MVHFKVSAVLPLPAADFFVERDSAAFRALVAKSMRLGGLEIVDGWMDGEDVEVYKFVTKPDLDAYVPKSLQKYLLKSGLHYTDIICYDPRLIERSPYRLHVTSIPPILPDKARIECLLTIEDEEPGKTCRQTLEGDAEFRVPVLGRLVEIVVADSLRKVYSGIPPIAEKWVEFREEVLKAPSGREVLFSGRPDSKDVPWINDRIQSIIQAPYTAEHAAEAILQQEELLDQGAALQLEGDTFYDSLDYWEWTEEEATWGGDEGIAATVKQDHAEAARLVLQARIRSAQLPAVLITAAGAAAPPDSSAEASSSANTASSEDASEEPPEAAGPSPDEGKPKGKGGRAHRTRFGRRFGKAFASNQAAWDGFWADQKVPVLPVIPELIARLAHLLHLVTVLGVLVPERDAKHADPAGGDGAAERAAPLKGARRGLHKAVINPVSRLLKRVSGK